MNELSVIEGLDSALGTAVRIPSQRARHSRANLVVRGRALESPRASLYFVGLRHDKDVRWVVKQPHPTAQQLGRRAPRPASVQLAALTRLHQHLGSSGTVRTPAPVGMLPAGDAFAMEHVAGRPLSESFQGTGRGRGRQAMLSAMEAAGSALLAIHYVDDVTDRRSDVRQAEDFLMQRAHDGIAASGVPLRPAWFEARVREPTWVREVRQHGQWTPDNVLVQDGTIQALSPQLVRRGAPEVDVADFLVALFDAPAFTLAGRLPSFASSRREAAAAFLRGYYGSYGVPALLRPVLVDAVAAQWAVRETFLREGTASHRVGEEVLRTRRAALRSHYGAVLDRICSDWLTDAVG